MHSPEEMLAEVNRLRRRTHQRAHAGAWLPAMALAVLLLASTVLYRYPFQSSRSLAAAYPFWAGLPDEQRSPVASYVFWFVGTPFVFALIAIWYQWRTHRVGMRIAWRPIVGIGLGTLLLLAVLAAVPKGELTADAIGSGPPALMWQGLLTPLLPVAAAVCALGWAERSRGLIACGGWIALLTLWLCQSVPLGHFPGWVDRLLNGGGGPGLGGELALRPGHYVLSMAVPLLLVGLFRAVRS